MNITCTCDIVRKQVRTQLWVSREEFVCELTTWTVTQCQVTGRSCIQVDAISRLVETPLPMENGNTPE